MPDKKIKVLHIASWYPNQEKPTLGIFIKKHLDLIGEFTQSMVCSVFADSAYTGKGEVLATTLTHYKEIQFHTQPLRGNLFKRLVALYTWSKQVKDISEKQFGTRPDLIHLHVIMPLAPMVLLLIRYWKVPVVFTEHWTGYQPEDGNYKGFLSQLFTKWLVRKSGTGIVVSQHLATCMEKQGLRFNPVVISNAVDTTLFSLKENSPKEEVVILHVSAMDDLQKNISGMLKVFAELTTGEHKVRLVLVGDGADLPALKKLAITLGIESKVDFKGRKVGQELVKEYHQASFFWLNSRYENQPVVVLEALCCGVPVLTTPCGALPEIVNSYNGILLSDFSEQSAKQGLLRMLEDCNHYSMQLVRDSAMQVVAPEVIKEKHKNVYSRLINA